MRTRASEDLLDCLSCPQRWRRLHAHTGPAFLVELRSGFFSCAIVSEVVTTTRYDVLWWKNG